MIWYRLVYRSSQISVVAGKFCTAVVPRCASCLGIPYKFKLIIESRVSKRKGFWWWDLGPMSKARSPRDIEANFECSRGVAEMWRWYVAPRRQPTVPGCIVGAAGILNVASVSQKRFVAFFGSLVNLRRTTTHLSCDFDIFCLPTTAYACLLLTPHRERCYSRFRGVS